MAEPAAHLVDRASAATCSVRRWRSTGCTSRRPRGDAGRGGRSTWTRGVPPPRRRRARGGLWRPRRIRRRPKPVVGGARRAVVVVGREVPVVDRRVEVHERDVDRFVQLLDERHGLVGRRTEILRALSACGGGPDTAGQRGRCPAGRAMSAPERPPPRRNRPPECRRRHRRGH